MSATVVQRKVATFEDVADDQYLTLDAPFTPGNSLVVLISCQHYLKSPDQTGMISGIWDNKSGFFTKRDAGQRDPDNGATTQDLYAEVWDCLGAADAAPSTLREIGVGFKRSTEWNNKGTIEVCEVAGLTAFVAAINQSGGAANSTTVSAVLDPQPAEAGAGFLLASHFSSHGGMPPGWTVLRGEGQTGNIPAHASCYRNLGAGPLSAPFTYGTTLYGAGVAGALYSTASLKKRIKITDIDPTVFDSTDTAITALVWRGEPEAMPALKFAGLAGSGTAGTLYIQDDAHTLPADLAIGANVNVVLFNATDGTTYIPAGGVVESW